MPRAVDFRRHFGPFYRGSSLDQINLWLDGSGAVSWHYGTYFDDLASGAAGKVRHGRYYPTAAVPASQALPAAAALLSPGSFPSSDGAMGVLLRGAEISYSSRYGGSARFTFEQQEDVGIELRRGQHLWDTNMRVHFYVPVIPAQFNNPAFLSHSVHVEVEPNVVQAYVLPTGSGAAARPTPVDQASTAADLAAIVESIRTSSVTGAASQQAARFMYGYLQNLFPDLVPDTAIVTSVTLTDGLFDTTTRAGIPTFDFSARVTNLRWRSAATVQVGFSADAILVSGASGSMNDRAYEFEVPRVAYSPVAMLGIFPLSVCSVFREINVFVSVHETKGGPLAFSGFNTAPGCPGLQQALTSVPSQVGIPITRLFEDVRLFDGGQEVGTMNVEIIVRLLLR